MAKGKSALLRIGGELVREAAADGFVCLNDIWSAFGAPSSLRVPAWKRQVRAVALIAALERQFAADAADLKKGRRKRMTLAAIRGEGHASHRTWWAHPIVALDYAEALSPDLSIAVKRFFLTHRRDALAAGDRMVERLEEEIARESDRLTGRESMIRSNRGIRAEAREAGCVLPQDYQRVNGAHYHGLYRMCLTEVRRRKGLTGDGAVLADYMGNDELAANLLAKRLELFALKTKRPNTPGAAAEIVMDEAWEVRELLLRTGLVVEDLPLEDHVSQPRKRVEQAMRVLDRVLPLLDRDDAEMEGALDDVDLDAEAMPDPPTGSVH